MLKHEDTSQTQSPAAAQVRVTPEELAAAVTALQIRKEGQPGTIAIGDAVEELGADVTPEEVLAEVLARRTKPKSMRDFRALACAFACVALFAGVESVVASHHHIASKIASATAAGFVQPDTFNEVGDEQQVYVDPYGLSQILEKVPQSQVRVSLTVVEPSWGLIKHGDKVYVQSYVSSQSRSQLKQSHVALYSSPPDGYIMPTGNGQLSYTVATLPVNGMRFEDSQMGEHAEKVVVSGIRPDGFLWEDNVAK